MDSAVLICLFVTLVMVLPPAANGESKMPITMDVMPNQRQPLRAETTQFVDAKSLPSNIGDIRPTDRVIDGGVEEVVDVVPPSGERIQDPSRPNSRPKRCWSCMGYGGYGGGYGFGGYPPYGSSRTVIVKKVIVNNGGYGGYGGMGFGGFPYYG